MGDEGVCASLSDTHIMDTNTGRIVEVRRQPSGYRIWKAWTAYHKANPEVYEWFVRLTFHKINRGFKRQSADFIMHVVRFEIEDVNPESSDKYKICNDYVAFYARLFAEEYPDQAGFFRYRQSVADQFFGPL